MKLSEAVLMGAMIRPQGVGPSNKGKSCALEAAAEAIGCGERGMHAVKDHWNWVTAPAPQCPHERRFLFIFKIKCTWRPYCMMYERIYHLNDHHFWTRERIAAWISTVEPQATIEPADAPAPVAREEVEA